jgi:hypothetical protein
VSFASGLYGDSALAHVLPVDLGGIPRDGAGAFTTAACADIPDFSASCVELDLPKSS